MIREIVSHKENEVETRKSLKPLSTFVGKIRPASGSFLKALKQKQTGFILECKKASPSKGLIRKDFDVAKIAQTYASFADCISVLTDEKYFRGSLSFLKTAAQNSHKPVLCKDFFISTYQVYEARFYGADAILLMLSVLNDETAKSLLAVAKKLSLDVLVEVHDEEELKRALGLSAQIIGINNRSFKTLETDLDVSRRLLPLVPRDKTIVLESGFFEHKDIAEFKRQVSAFLVGTSLMQSENLSCAVRRLIYGRVKVCGLTRVEDAKNACQSGASYGGLIFYEKSPRCVSEESALNIVQAAQLKWVGVFVNEEIEKVCKLVKKLGLSAVQLHGDEASDYLAELKSKLPKKVEIWKSFLVKETLPDFTNLSADRFLLDTYSETKRGGTGKRFDWSLLSELNDKSRIILSGGLSEINIQEAEKHDAWMLDLNSGVESSPGLKDKRKMQTVFEILRGKKDD